jgi:Gpi18-like mannosyltransferase
LNIKQSLDSGIASRKGLLKTIFIPFFLTRMIWEITAYYSAGNFFPNPTYEEFSKRGYFLTKFFPADIFARWDSRFYFSIMKYGYSPSADLSRFHSSMAFFPLYPWIVKSIGWLGIDLPDAFYVLFGVILSNLFFLVSAFLFHYLATRQLGFSEESVIWAICLLYAFPASFYFSSFYPESLFLLLSIAAFVFAIKDKWGLAALFGALAVLTRFQGVLLVFALVWLYCEKKKWQLREIKTSILWFVIPFLAFIGHSLSLYSQTGSFFTLFEAQNAWGRNQGDILAGIWANISGSALDVFKIDLVLTFLFLAVAIIALKKLPYKALGVYALVMILLPLATGSLVSVSRFLLVNFPVFLVLGGTLKRREYLLGLIVLWFALQIIYFSGWVNYYWIA